MAHVINRDRAFLIAHSNQTVSADELERFHALVARRASGEPAQYIIGHQEFFKLDFEITPDVLIPRPETDLMVELVLELLRGHAAPYFADLGTGSGCIAVSLLHELPAARGLAVDISVAALEVARRNAQRHGVTDRIRLVESDGFAAIDGAERFDLIVSNPPYVSDHEMNSLQREVQREPSAALAGGPDGLEIIRRLLQGAPPFIKAGGHFVFEIGFGQSEPVKDLIDRQMWELIEVRPDLTNIPRTVVLRRQLSG